MDGGDPSEMYAIMHGPVVFHYGIVMAGLCWRIVMAGLCWHALVYALVPAEPTSEEVEVDALHDQDEEDISPAESYT